MALEFAWLSEGLPIFGFVLVFVLIYAILTKTKILGETASINTIISLILSIIFLSFSSVRNYVINITPWFTVLLTISFFFMLIIVFLIKDNWTKFTKPLSLVFITLFSLILISAFFYTFPNTQAYLPGADESGANSFLLSIKHFILEKETLNGILLIIVTIVVGLIITK